MKDDRCTKCDKPLPASAKTSVCGYCTTQKESTVKKALTAAGATAVVLLAVGRQAIKVIMRR